MLAHTRDWNPTARPMPDADPAVVVLETPTDAAVRRCGPTSPVLIVRCVETCGPTSPVLIV